MARRCLTCDHSKRDEIDRLIENNSKSLTEIAQIFSLSVSSVWNHKRHHLEGLGKGQMMVDIVFKENSSSWSTYEIEKDDGQVIGMLYLPHQLILVTKTLILEPQSKYLRDI